jgi:cytochrome c oxidase subunit 2
MRRLAPLAAALLLSGCELPSFGMPHPRSEQGDHVFGLWQGAVVAALVVGVVVYALILWSVIAYRRRRGDTSVPSQEAYHVPLEIAYTAIPVVIVLVLFAFTLRSERKVDALSAHPDVVVEVRGFQWQWQFVYEHEDVTVTGEDGGSHPQLVLPVGSTVRLKLRSLDVDHSFWVPDFLVKRDLIPRIDNQIDVDVKEPGTYVGRCAEFCGLDHYRMTFEVRAVSEQEFRRWLAAHRGKAA